MGWSPGWWAVPGPGYNSCQSEETTSVGQQYGAHKVCNVGVGYDCDHALRGCKPAEPSGEGQKASGFVHYSQGTCHYLIQN